MTNPLLHSARWTTFKQLVFATYGDICWLCDHGGARQVDHVESTTDRPELIFVLANCRPAHGAPGNRCKICGQNCNQLRGAMSPERARKLIAERSATPGARSVKRYGEAPRPVKPEPPKDNGREW
jgi:hypothetical protein